MGKRRTPIRQAEIVRRFAVRLRELRHSRGLTQAQLAHEADVSLAYISRLEGGGAAPGLDLLDRLAKALRTTVTDLVPTDPVEPTDTDAYLREQAQRQFTALLASADRAMLLLLNPLLSRLADSGR